MLLPENIFEISATPNKNYWFIAYRIQCPINEYGRAWHFNNSAWLRGLWGEEKWLGGISIYIYSGGIGPGGPRQLTWTVIFLVGVLPLFFHRGKTAKRVM
jgi:hypothetical protein